MSTINIKNIDAFVRIRPLNSTETESCIATNVSSLKVSHESSVKTYHFSRVFDENSSQEDIFTSIAKPTINKMLSGHSCTIFTYGQTGSGKTFTMEGIIDDAKLSGIIPRAMSLLLSSTNRYNLLSIKVSFMEIYNEEIFDLFANNNKLTLFEDHKGNVITRGLRECDVKNESDFRSLLHRGISNRRDNEALSIFNVTVIRRDDKLNKKMVGKLYCVDLVGSDNSIRNKQNTGRINQSLLALEKVINLLAKGDMHIPYRESKLTRVLKDSLDGSSQTIIIATISPSVSCVLQTLSTLSYACKAVMVSTNSISNQTDIIKEYKETIHILKVNILATKERIGIELTPQLLSELDDNLVSTKKTINELTSQLLYLNKSAMEHECKADKERIIFEKVQHKLDHVLSVNEQLTKICDVFVGKLELAESNIIKFTYSNISDEDILRESLERIYNDILFMYDTVTNIFMDIQNKSCAHDKMINSNRTTLFVNKIQELMHNFSKLRVICKPVITELPPTFNSGEVVNVVNKGIDSSITLIENQAEAIKSTFSMDNIGDFDDKSDIKDIFVRNMNEREDKLRQYLDYNYNKHYNNYIDNMHRLNEADKCRTEMMKLFKQDCDLYRMKLNQDETIINNLVESFNKLRNYVTNTNVTVNSQWFVDENIINGISDKIYSIMKHTIDICDDYNKENINNPIEVVNTIDSVRRLLNEQQMYKTEFFSRINSRLKELEKFGDYFKELTKKMNDNIQSFVTKRKDAIVENASFHNTSEYDSLKDISIDYAKSVASVKSLTQLMDFHNNFLNSARSFLTVFKYKLNNISLEDDVSHESENITDETL